MKIPDYKKRAALAAENWKRLQAQKKPNSKESGESPKIEDESHEPTFDELIDNFVIPRTSVKGIRFVQDVEEKKKLRDIA
ncbi:hypothetical protein [Aurantibacter sp.]|uniref:hypothetical protein n=1 Tax=Aurantibacter sp. TaxID=2807103 RepID=UPI003267B505